MTNDSREAGKFVQGPPSEPVHPGPCPDVSCPLCKLDNSELLYERDLILYKCKKCGIIFNQTHRELNYNNDYFTIQYKIQYGRTYIEDFENIYEASVYRLEKIIKQKKNRKNINKLRLLDIGSAAGIFLKAAQDCGINDILGIEISGFAARYCAEQLGINVINASFFDISLPGQFDIITAWYFLEHSYDPMSAIGKIYSSLNKDGIFAFSIPSFFGPQFVFKRDEWLETHPADHRIDFSPATVKKFLKNAGFDKVLTFPGGIHPERIVGKDSVLYPFFKMIYPFISRLLSFSDTMEVYAVK